MEFDNPRLTLSPRRGSKTRARVCSRYGMPVDQTRAPRARSAPSRGSRSSARSARLIQHAGMDIQLYFVDFVHDHIFFVALLFSSS